MTPAQFLIAQELVSNWIEIRGKRVMNFSTLNFSVLQANLAHIQRELDRLTLHFKAIVTEYPLLSEKFKENNRLTGQGFNMLRFFSPGETLHSSLIAHLLNPRENHGQKNLFLQRFLELIEIESPEDKNWVVTAEEGRVDILLKRKHPLSIIIIENKSNWAGDQPNQLYRYWYENIFCALKDYPINYGEENKSRFRVIYLPPSDIKKPDENSLTRPDYLSDPFPMKLPMEVEIKTFDDFVIKWLEKCLPEIPNSNYRLREYVLQYIELWKTY